MPDPRVFQIQFPLNRPQNVIINASLVTQVNDGGTFGIQHIGLNPLIDHGVALLLHTIMLRHDLTKFIFVV